MKNPIAKNFLFETPQQEIPIRSGIATTIPAAMGNFNKSIPTIVTRIPLNEVRVPRKIPLKKSATG